MKIPLKSIQKCHPKGSASAGLHFGTKIECKTLPGRARKAQGASKTASGRPLAVPKTPQDGTRPPQELPMTAHAASKMPPRRFQDGSQRRLRGLWEAS